jgi:hypothetical protein
VRSSFLLLRKIVLKTGAGTHTAPYPKGIGGFFAGVKRPRREADYSLPSSAEVKNVWSYTFTPPYVFMARYLIKNRDNFALL